MTQYADVNVYVVAFSVPTLRLRDPLGQDVWNQVNDGIKSLSCNRQIMVQESLWLVSSYESAKELHCDIFNGVSEKYETDVSIFICSLDTENLDEFLLAVHNDLSEDIEEWIIKQISDAP